MPSFNAVGLDAVSMGGAPTPAQAGTTVAAFIGNAAANGAHATIAAYTTTTISASIGAATANGSKANIATQRSIAAQIGNAAANGMRAGIATAGIVQAQVGAASVNGMRANIISSKMIKAAVGGAIANGVLAAVSTDIVLPDPVFPSPDQVQSGVHYGPTGVEYTGTMAAGAGGYSLDDIAIAVWSSDKALTLQRFVGLK